MAPAVAAMILSNVADCYTAIATTTTTADNATMMTTNMPTSNQLANQEAATTDFWWWPNQQTDGSVAGHQHQQISSSSSQQHQQMDGDDFDGFDLSLLINGTSDGYFSDSTSDCRVPTAAISATVTVHANAALQDNVTAGGDYYPSTTTETAQQQLDIQQLLSIYDDICFFGGDAPEDNIKPMPIIHRANGVTEGDDAKSIPNFHHEQQGQLHPLATSTVTTTTTNTGVQRPSKSTASPAAVVPCVITTTTTTTTTEIDNTPNVTTADKTTLLRSLLTVTASSPSPAILMPETTCPPSDSTAVVESTTEVTTAITTTDNNSDARNVVTSAVEDNGNKANKHRLLIEMLRGTSNDDVVVPKAAVRSARRRPRSAVDDVDESSYGVRRRIYAPESRMDGQDMQQDNVNGDSLLLYGGAYLSTSPAWLDNMVAAAAAATTGTSNNANFYPCAANATGQQQNNMARRQNQPENRDDIDNIVDDCCVVDTDYCNDYNAIGNSVFDQGSTIDGNYYNTAVTEIAYSPPTAAQVPSVTPPPKSCGDHSTTTTVNT